MPVARDRQKIYFDNPSIQEVLNINVSGRVSGKDIRCGFIVSARQIMPASVPIGEPGTTAEHQIRFPGPAAPFKACYTMPDFISVRRAQFTAEMTFLPPIALRANDHILPADHTTWNEANDLSAELHIDHDHQKPYVRADVAAGTQRALLVIEPFFKGPQNKIILDKIKLISVEDG